ncbi:MAG: hypothetical protein N3B12_08145 [Armatimonadetes bacterium]|nr:hypothetical protein [Armatimonadota bacterium]
MSRSVARGIAIILAAVLILFVIALWPHKPVKKHIPPNDDPWILVNYDPKDPYGTYLGNGLISTRIMGDGVGSQNGKPLPCYMAGLYNEEKLVPIPTWSDLQFYDGKTRFAIDRSDYYKQTLNMHVGILTTRATWRAGRKTLKGKIEIIVSRADPNIGIVRAEVVPNFTGLIKVIAPLGKSDPALRFVTGSVAKTVHGERKLSVYRCAQSKIILTLVSIADMRLRAKRGARAVVRSCVSIASGQDVDAVIREAISHLNAVVEDVDAAIVRHKSAWSKLWKKDITICGPRKDQQVIHSCIFYLLSSVREGSKWSIPPMGLSDNAFNGHVFWDADIWMFPALILQHPELAKSIVEYRYQTLPGAIANARAAGMPGAQYAWESGYTGREATPEGLVYRHERHINGDVALAQWQYYLATSDLNWLKTRGWPVIKATADWWTAKAAWVPAANRYEILRVVPPDENAELVNNSVYTNAVAKTNLLIAISAARLVGQRSDPRWAKIAEKMYIPFDAKNRMFVPFDGYGRSAQFGPRYRAKQADTELLIYPLQFRFSGKSMTDIYRNTFHYYAKRVHEGGPAMTSSVHSVIAARLSDRARAYSDFVKSYKPFLRGPFNYFNEKPSKYVDNMCFLTGAAGPIQSVLFGLAGIRMEYFTGSTLPNSSSVRSSAGVSSHRAKGGSEEAVSKNTLNRSLVGRGEGDVSYGKVGIEGGLTFNPCLPTQWKSLKITGLNWRGKTFSLTVCSGDKVEITQE